MTRVAPEDGGVSEVERVLAEVDAAERELAGLREASAARRDEVARIESETTALLRRLLVAAEQAGNGPLRTLAIRELAAIEAES